MKTQVLGRTKFGFAPFGGPNLYDAALVTVNPVGDVPDTNAPTMTVGWTYSQPQARPQGSYRVTVTRDSDSATVYDSGAVTGAGLTHVFDASGVDSEVAITVHVTIEIDAGAAQGVPASDTAAGKLLWGKPHLTILSPVEGELVTDAALTPTWSFVDDRGGIVQGSYRVKLSHRDSGYLVYDSGWISGADVSFPVPFQLSDGSAYSLSIQLKNENGVLSD